MTLCPCLGDLCHPMDFKVQEQTSSFRAVPPIFSYNQEMGNFLHCLNHPSEALPQGFLCKLFLKHKDGIRVLSMACWHWGLGPSSDLYHTLVEPVVMTIFFIYTTPCFGGLGWVEEGWEPDERLHENSLHFPCSPGKEIWRDKGIKLGKPEDLPPEPKPVPRLEPRALCWRLLFYAVLLPWPDAQVFRENLIPNNPDTFLWPICPFISPPSASTLLLFFGLFGGSLLLCL